MLLPAAPYESYRAYLESVGSSAVANARSRAPADVLEEIRMSGLRGRGGAGFPTGVKWRTLHEHPCPTRYVVCNAAEGEPGTFKDRWLLRQNPYATIEGMLVAAHVIGAKRLYIAAKRTFTREIARLGRAIDEMVAAGLFDEVEVEITEGPTEYLFGEEKALLEVIESGEPLPREAHYPPYEVGLFATPGSPNPALVNNAETYAHAASVLRNGAAAFRKMGTHETPGTVLFTLSGDVRAPGIYELPAGVTLRYLVYDVGGGPLHGEVRAILSGVSTAPIGPEKLDTKLSFESLALIGSGLGSAGFIVLDESRSMPRVTQSVARFLYVESCNQCPACKHGLRTASSALDEIFDPGLATPDDYERAIYGARSAPQGNRCYLPVQGATLVPALMERFKADFTAQIEHPDVETAPFPIPLITDYDPRTKTFSYDDSFARKRPNWTYEPEPQPAPDIPDAGALTTEIDAYDLEPPAERLSVPGRPPKVRPAIPEGPVGVRLAQDVIAAIRDRDSSEGAEMDRVVNDLLRLQLGLPRQKK